MKAYDDLVAALDGAMVVVTAGNGEEVDGCLVGFHSQCSIEPRCHAVWLSVANRTFEIATRATHLVVHLLGDDDRELAEHFGGNTGDEVDKLAGVDWDPGPGGTPVVAAAPAWFAGSIVAMPDRAGGDHQLFVVAVEEVGGSSPADALRLTEVIDIAPGHEPEDRR